MMNSFEKEKRTKCFNNVFDWVTETFTIPSTWTSKTCVFIVLICTGYDAARHMENKTNVKLDLEALEFQISMLLRCYS